MHKILLMAKRNKAKGWKDYSRYKKMIEDLNLSPENYERAIYELCKVLEI